MYANKTAPEYTFWWCLKDDHYGGPYSPTQKCPHCEKEKRDPARDAVVVIVDDICGRSGLGDAWDEIDEEIQYEILDEWAKIIEASFMPENT